MSSPTITAIIVTYNRKKLLERCLSAITTQTRRPDAVLVIDNASTDGTPAWLHKWMPLHLPQATLIALDQNTGGAGGFAAGMKLAFENGAEWVWMMDDDAEPHPEALEQLMRVATDPSHVYGSLAVCGDETSWLTTVLNPPLGEVERPEDVPEHAEVQSLPFLGFLIHRDLVARIGLPDTGYFIAADDVEYCVRATCRSKDHHGEPQQNRTPKVSPLQGQGARQDLDVPGTAPLETLLRHPKPLADCTQALWHQAFHANHSWITGTFVRCALARA